MEYTELEKELFHKEEKKEVDTGNARYLVSFNSSKVDRIDNDVLRIALENFVMNMLSDLSISCKIEKVED